MSGYRSLHRERASETTDGIPLWSVQFLQSSMSPSSSSSSTHILSGSGDGYVRIHSIREKEIEASQDASATANVLDASALSLTLTHALIGNKNQVYPPVQQEQREPIINGLMGITQVSCIRNYVGDDTMAGDFIVASLDLSGRVRVWTLPADDLTSSPTTTTTTTTTATRQVKANHEFVVRDATGTILALRKPKQEGPSIMMAVACLDGTVQLVSAGLKTPKYPKDASPPAGEVIHTLGSPESSIVLSLVWHPTDSAMIVGRKDGTVEIMALSLFMDNKNNNNNNRKSSSKHHRMTHAHAGPVRGLTLTPDAQLLVSGSDDGYIAIWDLNRNVPTLVHHVDEAHSSWILSLEALSDSRRFLSCGAEGKIHVWNVGQIYAPMHTYDIAAPDRTWTMSAITTTSGAAAGSSSSSTANARFVSGSEQGYQQVYSIETK